MGQYLGNRCLHGGQSINGNPHFHPHKTGFAPVPFQLLAFGGGHDAAH